MRTRIIGVAVLAAVVATVLFAVPLGAGAFEYLVQHERVHLVGHARDVALRVAGDVHDGAPIDLEDVEDLVGEDHRVTVYDGDGDRLAGSGPDAPADVVSDALDGDVGADTAGDRFVAAVPVTYSDEVIGAVAVATPSTVLRDVAVIWAAMAGLAAAAVTVAWLVGRRQARRLARPLEDLEESADGVGLRVAVEGVRYHVGGGVRSGPGDSVAVPVVDGHEVVVPDEILDVLEVDGRAVVHVAGHAERDVPGVAHQVHPLVLHQVLERPRAQRHGEQDRGDDGSQHGHADDASAHEASPLFLSRRPARFPAAARMPGPGGAVTALRRDVTSPDTPSRARTTRMPANG